MAYSRQIGLVLLAALLFGALLAVALIVVQFIRSTTVVGPSATPTPTTKDQLLTPTPQVYLTDPNTVRVVYNNTYSTIAYV